MYTLSTLNMYNVYITRWAMDKVLLYNRKRTMLAQQDQRTEYFKYFIIQIYSSIKNQTVLIRKIIIN